MWILTHSGLLDGLHNALNENFLNAMGSSGIVWVIGTHCRLEFCHPQKWDTRCPLITPMFALITRIFGAPPLSATPGGPTPRYATAGKKRISQLTYNPNDCSSLIVCLNAALEL